MTVKPRPYMQIANGQIFFREDAYADAKKHGFDSPDLLIVTEYGNGKSGAEIGLMLHKTDGCIYNRLKAMGVKRRPQGGCTKKGRWQKLADKIILSKKNGHGHPEDFIRAEYDGSPESIQLIARELRLTKDGVFYRLALMGLRDTKPKRKTIR